MGSRETSLDSKQDMRNRALRRAQERATVAARVTAAPDPSTGKQARSKGLTGVVKGSARSFHDGKRAAFLDELRRLPVLGHAARAVGVDPSTVYLHRKQDQEFDRAVLAAIDEGVDRLEAETYAEAMQPADKGRPTHLLKMFYLKSKRPEVFGERLELRQTQRHEIVINLVPPGEQPEGAAGGAADRDVVELGPGEWRALGAGSGGGE